MNTVSVISYARDSFGLTLAAERYGSRLFRNDSRPGGVLQTPNKLKPDAAARLKASWNAAHTGGGQHRVAVLEEGIEWKQIGISPEEAQFLGTREFQAEDVCRWFRVPPHMVGLTSKATSWGSGIEEMTIGFLTYTLQPWLTRWTQAIRRDLILAPNSYFADFVTSALLKGDTEGRYNAYAIGRQWGWLSVNDIRRFENMNPVPNGDAYLQPMNMVEAEAVQDVDVIQVATPAPTIVVGTNGAHYRLLAEEAAGRLVRKERAAISRMIEKAEGETAVREFYANHTGLVAQTMRIPVQVAQDYCDQQVMAALFAGEWPDNDQATIERLADLAIGEI
ncbi:MAG: phage portal protein [Anaerolineae bacterium]|nr:phage portal protein [Anaerolineae bacterium]